MYNNSYSPYYFVDFLSLTVQVAITLFSILKVTLRKFKEKIKSSRFYFQINFFLGYVFLPVQTIQIFMPCWLSTLLIDAGEKYHNNLCSISWYLMKEPEKKSIFILMQSSINPKSMLCGLGVMDLSLFIMVVI